MSDINDKTFDVSVHDEVTDDPLKVYPDGSTDARISALDSGGSRIDLLASSDGRLLVSTPPPTNPTGTTPIEDIQLSDENSTDNHFVVIPTGQAVTIQRFKAGGEGDNRGNAVYLFYAPNGNTSGLVLIEVLYVDGSSRQIDLNYTSAVGDGTKSILLRRKRLSSGMREIFGKWEGYY